jgi:hypothetical protein
MNITFHQTYDSFSHENSYVNPVNVSKYCKLLHLALIIWRKIHKKFTLFHYPCAKLNINLVFQHVDAG